jgi:hypothetical protein
MNEPHETMPSFPSNRVSLYAALGGEVAQRFVAVQSPSKSRAN